jgi:hypothetical protein
MGRGKGKIPANSNKKPQKIRTFVLAFPANLWYNIGAEGWLLFFTMKYLEKTFEAVGWL